MLKHKTKQPNSKLIDMVKSITENTKRKRLREDFGLNPTKVKQEIKQNERTNPLMGYCHENAIALAKELSNHGFQPELIWGAVTPSEENVDISTVTQAEKRGCVHIWVEVPHPDDSDTKTIIAEIASEYDGTTQVVTSLPEKYTRPKDCRFEFDEDIITPDLLINSNGYKQLKSYDLIVSNK